MKIQVLDEAPEQFESTWEGVTRTRCRQWAVLTVKGRPMSFQLTSDVGKHYAAGDYELAPESFSISNGRLTVSRVVLTPLASLSKVQPTPAKASA